MNQLKIESPFSIVSNVADDIAGIERVLARYHEKSATPAALDRAAVLPVLKSTPGWEASYHRLDLSSAFNGLSPVLKNEVLLECSKNLMEEALLIEIAGMSFAAKMSLLSETLQQRELYSHFATDEANHYRMIRTLVGPPRAEIANGNAFLVFLSELIQETNRLPLLTLIQVLLEGWGLSHYHGLAQQARIPEVRQVLEAIVADEAAHHGTGLLFAKNSRATTSESEQDLEITKNAVLTLLEMLKVGPAGVFLSLVRTTGSLPREEIRRFLVETSFEVKLENDLALMKRLLEKAESRNLLDALETNSAFEMPTIDHCCESLFALQSRQESLVV